MAPMSGIDTIDYMVDGRHIILHNIYYVPSIQYTLYSIKIYMQYLHCYFHAENNIMTLK